MTLLKVLGTEVNAATLGPQTFSGNTANVTGNHIVFGSGQRFTNGQVLTYYVAAGNTAITGLANGSSYYAVFANSTNLNLSLTLGGANIATTTACASVSETGHTLYAANNLSKIQTVRIFNTNATPVVARISNTDVLPPADYATISVLNAEVLYLQKSANDVVWCNGSVNSVSIAPIALKG